MWNADLSLPVKEFDLSEPEIARIKTAIQTWDSYGAAADRHWLEPLVVADASTRCSGVFGGGI